MKIEEDGIKLEKSPEMLTSARRLSDYIRELPLTAEQNDKLVQMLLDHVGDVQRCGFNQGLKVGKEFAGWEGREAPGAKDFHRLLQ